ARCPTWKPRPRGWAPSIPPTRDTTPSTRLPWPASKRCTRGSSPKQARGTEAPPRRSTVALVHARRRRYHEWYPRYFTRGQRIITMARNSAPHEQAERLYEKYGEPLDAAHPSDYV